MLVPRIMDYYRRDSHSSVPLHASHPLTIPSCFEYAASWAAQHGRVARGARTGARATLLAGLLVLLCIASPQAWSRANVLFTASGAIYSSPAIGVDGTIYFGSSDGRLYAVQSNGA